ncbi:MAG TPA: ATP synthase F0 subunit C [Candidatus Saccharimonadales bacterium]|nr:ATP synthase F0 subunit C [Candidatus Saccharimonadales bacterium]
MIDFVYILLSLIPLLLSAFGTSIGQGLIGKHALRAMQLQPASHTNIVKFCIIAVAVTETAALLGFLMTTLLVNSSIPLLNPYYAHFGVLGIAIALGLSGLCAGIASSFPAMAACTSLARQPFTQNKILTLMLITQTLIMTPNIFGLIISFFIKAQLPTIITFNQALQFFSSGLSIGLGCVGPSIGLCLFAYGAISTIGFNKKAYGKIRTFTFICISIIETPVIFSLVISLMILGQDIVSLSPVEGWKLFAAAICVSLSSLFPGINSGKTAATACTQIGLHLDQYPTLSKITMLTLAMIDSFAIYGLLISILILIY